MKRLSYTRKGEWLELHVGAKSGMPPEEAALAAIPVEPAFLRRLKAENGLQLQGNRLMIRMFPLEAAGFEPQWADLDVLFEDDFCLVAHKPAGMSVHPSREGQTETLANRVAGYYEATGQSCRVRHIHRLDADTTGPVLYAKTAWSQRVLDARMRQKAIGRIYLALAQGRPGAAEGVIDEPIGRDRHHPGKRRVSSGGDPARTRYEVIETFRDASLLRVRLETGRTHQIRVHLSHTGHPILGDVLYGGSSKLIGRQALHGEALVFCHPLDGETIEVRDPLPGDMLRLLDRLRLESSGK